MKDEPAEGGAADAVTSTGLAMGTPSYMPPEQFEDARSADERADVYALGVMLFLALAGKLPYAGPASAVQKRHLRVQEGVEAPPRPSDTTAGAPAALEALCSRALELDPAKRLASAEAFVLGLEQALVVGATTETMAALPAESRPARPRRASGFVVAVLVLCGLLAAAYGGWKASHAPAPDHAATVEVVESDRPLTGRVVPGEPAPGGPLPDFSNDRSEFVIQLVGVPAKRQTKPRTVRLAQGFCRPRVQIAVPGERLYVENLSGADCVAGPFTIKNGESSAIRLAEDLTLRIGENAWGFVRVSEDAAAVTDDEGGFTLFEIPRGRRTVRVWHPLLSEPWEGQVEIGERLVIKLDRAKWRS
jgi:hypothetical protein